jgi:hypothetical protein
MLRDSRVNRHNLAGRFQSHLVVLESCETGLDHLCADFPQKALDLEHQTRHSRPPSSWFMEPDCPFHSATARTGSDGDAPNRRSPCRSPIDRPIRARQQRGLAPDVAKARGGCCKKREARTRVFGALWS